MFTKLNDKEYLVNSNEFEINKHDTYSNLLIRKDIGELERLISLINELSIIVKIKTILIYNTTHGGYLPINCAKYYENIILLETQSSQADNILYNKKKYAADNIHFLKYLHDTEKKLIDNSSFIIFSRDGLSLDMEYIRNNKPLFLTILQL